jgi:hypothetical protein
VLVVALVFVSNLCLPSVAAAQQSDQVAAERALGPRWKQLSRRAGMIFAGTVLATATPPLTTQNAATVRQFPSATPSATPALQLSFRVDEAIVGVEAGQVLTIHEWVGAWSMHRPMRKGQHILIFLYPPSRLGLTSPVGGSLGQVTLDSSGRNVSNDAPPLNAHRSTAMGLRDASSPHTGVAADHGNVSVVQLERAILSARNEEE